MTLVKFGICACTEVNDFKTKSITLVFSIKGNI